MKLILFGLAFVAIAAGKQYLPPLEESVEVEAQYLPPEQEAVVPEPDNQYLAPIEAVEPIEQIADDGYRYKTVKRLRYRNRRDVSELTSGQYLPPSIEDSYGPPPSGPAPIQISAPAPIQDSAVLADDGYRYKTVRRIRYRHRRDVNELSSAQYLPPTQVDDSYSYPAPTPVVASAPVAPIEFAAPAPVEIPAPVVISAPAPVQQSAELADDGYRYKTVKRIRYRHRRDVNELSSAQYLPPAQLDDSYSYPAPAPVVASAPVAPIEIAAPAPVEIPAPVVISAPAPVQLSAELADDGYRYKTVKRIRYRHRRDVNELSSAQYLPPVQEDDSYSYPGPAPIVASAPVAPIEIAAPAPVEIPAPLAISAPAPVQLSAELADDGYRYKTVKRIRYRHRRDVNELSSAQYLPPVQEDDSYSYPGPAPIVASAPVAPIEIAAPAPVEIPAPVVISAPAPVQQSAELADDGYRYKTVKRIRYRHRRDVNELSSAQYLPPVQEDDSYSYPGPAPIVASAPVAPIEIAAPAPVEIPAPLAISAPAPVQLSAELADDGYRYKTAKRIRYRHRRDVNELSSAQYLPPVQEDDSYSYPGPAPIVASAPVAPIEIAAPAPVEIPAPVVISAPAPVQQSAELADDGYRYKTVKRIRYRHRRDVNELSSAQYLPPVQEDDSYSYPGPASIVASAPVAPIEIAAPAPVEIPAPLAISAPAPVQLSAELADDGYRYKTVKRIRYRHRRDVNELSSAQYLPPVQEDDSYSYPGPAPIVASAPVAPIEIAAPAPVEIPAPVVISAPAPVQLSAELADDGYRYKTVKRIRYRHRRDVNELSSAQYLPPVQEDDSYSYPGPAPIVASAPIVAAAPVTPIEVAAPIQVEIPAPVEISAPAPIQLQQSAELADDGYRYKTVRRIRYRHRRDVNEIPAEYLPPTEELSYQEPSNQYLAPIEAVEPIEQLAQDGYRYKTVKKYKIKRH